MLKTKNIKWLTGPLNISLKIFYKRLIIKIFVTTPFIWEEHETPYDFQRYTSFGIKKLFEKHGFDIISHKKLVENKLAIFLIIESELTKYIDSFVRNRFLKIFFKSYFMIVKIIFKFILKSKTL